MNSWNPKVYNRLYKIFLVLNKFTFLDFSTHKSVSLAYFVAVEVLGFYFFLRLLASSSCPFTSKFPEVPNAMLRSKLFVFYFL